MRRRSTLTSILITTALACLAHLSVAAELIVVDPRGGADYVELQDAVDAATEGAVILIRGGTYSRPDGATWRHGILLRRPMTLLADPLHEAPTLLAEEGPALEIDLLGGGEVRLEGLQLSTGGWCTDSVLRMWSADRLLIDSCLLTASDGIDDWCPLGPDALWSRSGEVILRNTEARAGTGGMVFDPFTGATYGASGGTALASSFGRVLAIGCVLHGGNGGDGYDGWSGSGFNGDGGDALWAPRAYAAGGDLSPGLPGQGPAPGGRDGVEAPPWAVRVTQDLTARGAFLAGESVRLEASQRSPGSIVSFFAALDPVGLPILPPAAVPPVPRVPLAGTLVRLGQATTDDTGIAGLRFSLPSEPALLGLVLVMLASDRSGITNPEIGILLPPAMP